EDRSEATCSCRYTEAGLLGQNPGFNAGSFFFFKQKTAYEIGLGIPAEPLFRSRRSLLLALRLLWKTPIFPSNSRFPRLCAKCLLKLKRLVSILPMTKSKK